MRGPSPCAAFSLLTAIHEFMHTTRPIFLRDSPCVTPGRQYHCCLRKGAAEHHVLPKPLPFTNIIAPKFVYLPLLEAAVCALSLGGRDTLKNLPGLTAIAIHKGACEMSF